MTDIDYNSKDYFPRNCVDPDETIKLLKTIYRYCYAGTSSCDCCSLRPRGSQVNCKLMDLEERIEDMRCMLEVKSDVETFCVDVEE